MRNNQNKTIGIIGGVGPQASEMLYHKIIKLSQEKYRAVNNDDYPQIVLYSVPVPDFISDEKKIKEALAMFEKVIADFGKIGIDNIAIASNTVHFLIGDFQKMTKIPFISLIDAVIERVRIDNRKKVGLLASPMTIKSGIYEKPLAKVGTKLLCPEIKDQRKIEKMIRIILAGEENGELKEEYIRIVQKLFDKGAEAIILGCTELPMAINYEAIKHRIYNTDEILAEKIVDTYYQDIRLGKLIRQ